jgi:hypothetical protein
MKSINQLFKTNKDLLEEPEVINLIEYTRELEEIVMNMDLSSKFNKEAILLSIVRDIYSSCKQTIAQNDLHERFPDEVEYISEKESIHNLKTFIFNICRDNNIIL